jgi:hypothetical protein
VCVGGPGVEVDVDCGDGEGVGEDLGADVEGEGEETGYWRGVLLYRLLSLSELVDVSWLLDLAGLLTLVVCQVEDSTEKKWNTNCLLADIAGWIERCRTERH